MNVLELSLTVASIAVFVLVIYEAFTVARFIGRMLRFWTFFVIALFFLLLRRIVALLSTEFGLSLPGNLSVVVDYGAPLIISVLLLLSMYDMKKTFERTASKTSGSTTSDQS